MTTNNYMAYLAEKKPYLFGPIPSKNDVTLMKCTLWDNGTEPKLTAKGNKGKKTRFGFTIECYDKDADTLRQIGLPGNYSFKRNVAMKDRTKFRPLLVKNSAAEKLSKDFHDDMIAYVMHEEMSKSLDLFGFVIDSGVWNYHEQLVHVRLNEDLTPDVIHVIDGDGEPIALTQFIHEETEDGFKYMSHVDRCGYY